jgi:AcrR family transcriptional regulator
METTERKNVFPIGEIVGTKEAILLAAFELFGTFGYGGASVRSIAKTAGVNLAAINYHFKNKEELFWQVMEATYLSVDLKIHDFQQQSHSVIEMAERIYDFFVVESLAVRNTMKMMLSEGISGREHMDKNSPLMDPMGPPGGRHLAVMIQKETPYHLSEEGMLWSIKAIFGSIFHWALMVTSGRICPNDPSDEPLMSKEQIKKDVLLMVRSTMDFVVREEPRFSLKVMDKNP